MRADGGPAGAGVRATGQKCAARRGEFPGPALGPSHAPRRLPGPPLRPARLDMPAVSGPRGRARLTGGRGGWQVVREEVCEQMMQNIEEMERAYQAIPAPTPPHLNISTSAKRAPIAE